ncbi:hypothetical protein EZV62_026731 [Acer yangbiense]|uniref:(+)-delta-cadinene synthase n=1 Tax=Acer yangbiense TaxID=1000413 RepID=A0A5C7GSI9_9ROSI|nr:hypothetical protein EZV62_026731 [Acer yangbiense]
MINLISIEEEDKNRQAEKLKEEVKLMFGKSMELLAKLEFIDILMKLGLSILFEKEIIEVLDTIAASIKINNYTLEEDLYATALCFRLLRLHGHEMSQDIFRGFMDGSGSFSTSKCRDIKGLIELFEASHLSLEGENILEEAKGFSNGILMGAYSALDGELAEKVAHILELPTHWRLDWFQVKWHLKMYEKNNDINSTTTILCELAKLNFNMVQATHQNELKEVSRWWKNLGLVGKLKFARDRVIESFLTGLGLVSDPKQSSYRKWFAKAIALVIVIDDIYDVYGSLEELQHFTNDVDWLWNDLSTFKAEVERGDTPSAIQCYMREANVSEEIARNHFTDLIRKTSTKVNGLVLPPSAASLKPFLNVLANYPRVAYCLYQHGDGFGIQEDLKSKILSVLIEPV